MALTLFWIATPWRERLFTLWVRDCSSHSSKRTNDQRLCCCRCCSWPCGRPFGGEVALVFIMSSTQEVGDIFGEGIGPGKSKKML